MAYIPYNQYKGEYMAGFEVIFYEKENGDCPVEEFIDSLDVKMRAKMVGLLELLVLQIISNKNNDIVI